MFSKVLRHINAGLITGIIALMLTLLLLSGPARAAPISGATYANITDPALAADVASSYAQPCTSAAFPSGINCAANGTPTSTTLHYNGLLQRLTSVTSGGVVFYPTQIAPQDIVVNRNDQPHLGHDPNRVILLIKHRASSVSDISNIYFDGPRVNTVEETFLLSALNIGIDNVFENTGLSASTNNFNNIESMEFVFNPVVADGSLARRGFSVIERGGNDSFKIAGLKGSGGSCASYEVMVQISVTSSGWGPSIYGANQTYLVARRDPLIDPEMRIDTLVTQAVTGMFFSLQDLGFIAGDTVCGYALYSPDSTGTDPFNTTQNPATSSIGNMLDLIASVSMYSADVDADMSVSLGGLPATAQVGAPYSGSFSCANSVGATADATNATCGVSGLPAGVSVGSCTISPSNTPWTSPATVPVGQTVTCSVSGTPTTPGTVTVTGNTGAVNDPITSNNSAQQTINVAGATADLSIAKNSNPNSYIPGQSLTYTIVVSNSGPSSVTGAQVQDSLPAPLSAFTWTCTAGSGGSCGTASGSGSINALVNLPNGASATFTVSGTVPAATTGALTNTATVTPPAGVTDPAGNNSSTVVTNSTEGTVSGLVFSDLNGNGTQDPGEGGLSGVTVELLDSNGAVVATATTGANGSYAFPNVTPGAYTVRETDPTGYTSTTNNTAPISVAPGGAATANFGDQQPGAISGVVFNDLNGNGVRDSGEPGIGGVRIEVLDSNNNVIATTATTGDGRYLFSELNSGAYTVREIDPVGFVSTTPNTGTATVPPGGVASPDFGDQQQGTINGAVFNDLNSNGVRDTGEPGIGGVAIELLDVNGNVVAVTTTVGNGSYSFASLAVGNYSVQETDPVDFASTTSNVVAVTVPPGGSASAQFGDRQQGVVSPSAVDDTSTGNLPGSTVSVPVLANDTGASSPLDPASVRIIGPTGPVTTLSVANQGVWTVSTSSGAISFTPQAGFTGNPTPIQYQVANTDGDLSNTASVTITYQQTTLTLDAVNDAFGPVGPDGSANAGNVLTNDIVGGAPANLNDIILSVVTPAGSGVVPALNPATGVVSVPPSTPPGVYRIVYQICARSAPTVCDTAAMTIPVEAVFVPPSAVDDTSTGNLPGSTVSVPVLANDTGASAPLDPASVRIIGPTGPVTTLSVANQGVWTVNTSSGAISFTPQAGFTGNPTPIQYQVANLNGEFTTGSVTITYDLATVAAIPLDAPWAIALLTMLIMLTSRLRKSKRLASRNGRG